MLKGKCTICRACELVYVLQFEEYRRQFFMDISGFIVHDAQTRRSGDLDSDNIDDDRRLLYPCCACARGNYKDLGG